MKTHFFKTLVAVILILLPALHYGQIAPDLKSAGNFAILAGTAITSAAPASQINDLDIGLSPGFRSSITGFPPSIVVNGAIYAADDIAPPGVPAMLLQAKQDLLEAYLFAAASSNPAPATVSGDQGGTTLAPGIYKSNSSLLIQSGDLTLDGQGDVNAVWIFQIATNFTSIGGGPNPSPTGGNVILTNGARADNVFWQVGISATIGDYTDFKGNVMALTSITMNSGATLEGRLLARNGAVTISGGGIISKPDEGEVLPRALAISKTADPRTYSAVGDLISYDIVVENIGTETLTGVIVTDDLTGNSWTITLISGQVETLTTSYVITQEDLNNGSVVNIATAQVGIISASNYEVITAESALPPPTSIPVSTWAIILGGVLIALFAFLRYRRAG
jgi:uncharacterized repeat protein (TIGR01451 family)